MNPTFVRCSARLFAALAPALAAAADDDLAEVVVTASLAETTLAQLPASVTVLNAQQLGAAGLAHFADVAELAPNLGFAGGTSRPRYFQIRGIGELEQYEGAPNPSVGFLIDDIDFSGIAMPAALFDLQQAEVLRGPQGTAYGANAIAGLISLRSQAPKDQFEMRGEVEAGNYDTYSAGLVVNNAIAAGETAWRLGLHRTTGDGFTRNAWLQRRDTNGFDENLARLRVASQLTADLQLNVTALYADADNGYDAWALDNSRVTQSNSPGVDAQLSRALAVRFDYQGRNGVSLRSISSVSHADMDYAFDGDWGNDVLWGVNGPYDFYERIDRTRRNLSQEVRLRGGSADRGWIAGVHALQMREQYALLDLYNGVNYRQLASNYRALSLAAYGQIDRRLTSALSLSGGLRLERRTARYRDSNLLARDPADTMTGGHLALTWQLAANNSAYAAVTRGYKAGGVNTTAVAIEDDLRSFAPEYLWNLEAGLRTRSVTGAFDTRTSLFYMRRSNQQVASSVQPDPSDPLTFVLLTDNAARGDNIGLESELGLNLAGGVRLAATAALLRARFLSYWLEGRNLGGRDSAHAPSYQFGLAVDWQAQSGWFARAALQAVDGYYFSASHDQRASQAQLVNLRLGYAAPRWSATLYARNVLNEHYAVRGFYFANEPPDWAPKRYTQQGDPRQLGLRLQFGF